MVLEHRIRIKIVKECNSVECFSFIADEASDISTAKQVAICIRFYYRNIIRDEFLGFFKVESTTGEALAEIFLRTMRGFGISVDNMVHFVGQGYDGASNMRGCRQGVQARTRELYPEAIYLHCHAHCLNLAIIHASNEMMIRNMMHTVQEKNFAFSYSAKRTHQFRTCLEATPHKLENRKKLRAFCETRWSARGDDLHVPS